MSIAVITLNVGVFSATSLLDGGARAEVHRRAEEIARYVLERPYLSLAPDLSVRLGLSEAVEEARAKLQADELGAAERLQGEQATLNRMTDELRQATNRLPTWRFGFVPAAPRPEAVISSMFLHAGLLHLLANMLFFFLSGPFVEDIYGRAVFACLYLLSGMAAVAAHAVASPLSGVPLIGASGAIAGVMGAFLIRLARSQIEFLVLPIPFLPTLRFTLVLPAFVALPLWAAGQYWSATQAAGDTGVAWWAHLGGFAFGILAALAIRGMRLEESWIRPRIEQRISLVQHPGLERALTARLAHDLPRARRELDGVLQAEPENLDGWRESLEIALAAADEKGVNRSAIRLLELLQQRREIELSLALIRDARLRDHRLSARFWCSAGSVLERDGDGREALVLYERAVTASPEDPSALRALVRRGEILALGGNLPESERAYTQARAHPACQEPWLSRVEGALREIAARQAESPRTSAAFDVER